MSGFKIPPGQTWFDTHKQSFQDVPINPNDKGIATTEFLDASAAVPTLFGMCTNTRDLNLC